MENFNPQQPIETAEVNNAPQEQRPKSRAVLVTLGIVILVLITVSFLPVFSVCVGGDAYDQGNFWGWIINSRDCDGLPEPTIHPTSFAPSELEILAELNENWLATLVPIPFRPTYHNQEEGAEKIWREPSAVQFIGRESALVRFEDDNNVHIALLLFSGGRFTLVKTFQNQGDFTFSDWQSIVKSYGDPFYQESTYVMDLVRDGKIVSFPELTNVPENIFVRGYSNSE